MKDSTERGKIPLDMLHLRNPSNRETKISLYLAVHIQIEISVWTEIWICTEEFEFLDLVDFMGVALSVESVVACSIKIRQVHILKSQLDSYFIYSVE